MGRNPLWVQFTVPNYATGGASAQTISISFAEASVAGDTIAIPIDGVTYTFTCVSGTPDDSGLQYQEGGTALLAAVRFEAALNANYHVTAALVISRSTTVIDMTHRLVGAGRLGVAVDTPGTRFLFADTPGVDMVYAENYRLGVRLHVLYGNTEIVLPEMAGATNLINGNGPEFNLKGLLTPFMGHEWPLVGWADALDVPYAFVRWWVEAWESYGDPPTPKIVSRFGSATSPYRAWNAGMSIPEIGQDQLFLTAVTGPAMGWKHPFLTWRGRQYRREVTTAEQHVLGFYNWSTDSWDNLQVEARLHYTDADGTNAAASAWTMRYVNGGAPAHGQYNVAQWAMGYTQLNMAGLLPATKLPTGYDVRIRGNTTGNILSEEYAFYVVKPDYQETILEYVSSFGMIETLRCIGGWALGTNADLMELQKARTMADSLAYYAPHFSAAFSAPLGEQRSLQCNTGTLSREELAILLDVITAREVRWFDVENQRKVAVRLLPGEQKIVSRGDADENLYALNLDMLVHDPELHHSAAASLPVAYEEPDS